MYYLAYKFYRGFTSLAYWIRRRFTATGFALLGGMIISGAAGLDIDQSLIHQGFVFLVCLLGASLVCAGRFRETFGVTRALPRFASAGQPFSYRVTVRNLTSRWQNGLLVTDEIADPRPNFEEFVAEQKAVERHSRSFRLLPKRVRLPRTLGKAGEKPLPALPPGGQADVTVELLPLRRGVLRLVGAAVGRPDPLGVFKAFSRVPAPDTVLILPKRYPLPPFALPGSIKYQQGGVTLASSVGESEEFVSLRDYRPGDPLRHIHWRTWARAGKPIVKEFQDEFFVRHGLVLDTFTDVPQGWAFEEAVSLAASFACTIQSQESLLDLLFVGTQAYCFTAGRGLAHTEQLLEILAAVRPCHQHPFETLKTLVLNHAGRVSGCIVILLAWDEPRREFVKRLKLLGVPLRVLVVTEPGGAGKFEKIADVDVQVLEAGKIEEGLSRM